MSKEEDEISILSRPLTPPWVSKPEDKAESLFCPWEYPDAQPPPPPPHYANWSPVSPRKTMKPAGLITPSEVSTPRPVHFNRPSPTSSPLTHRRVLFRPDDHRRSHSEGRKPPAKPKERIELLAPKSESSITIIPLHHKVNDLQEGSAEPQKKQGEPIANAIEMTQRNSNDSGRHASGDSYTSCLPSKTEASVQLVTCEKSEEPTGKMKVIDVKLQSKRVSRKTKQDSPPAIDQTPKLQPPWRKNECHPTKQPNVNEMQQSQSSPDSEVPTASSEDKVASATTMVSVHSQSVQTQQASFLQQHQRATQQQTQQRQQPTMVQQQQQELQKQSQQPTAKEVPWRSPRASRKEVGKPPTPAKDKVQEQPQPSWRTAHLPKQAQASTTQSAISTTDPSSASPLEHISSTALDSVSKSASIAAATSTGSSTVSSSSIHIESKVSESVKKEMVSESCKSESSLISASQSSVDSQDSAKISFSSIPIEASSTATILAPPPPPPPATTIVSISSKVSSSTTAETSPKITTKEENICSLKETMTEVSKQTIPLKQEVQQEAAKIQHGTKVTDVDTKEVNKEQKREEAAQIAEQKSSIVAKETKSEASTIGQAITIESQPITEQETKTPKQESNLQSALQQTHPSPPPPPPPPPILPQGPPPIPETAAERARTPPREIPHYSPISSSTSLLQETSALQYELTTQEEAKEFAVEPITSRIQRFEKQSSFETDKTPKDKQAPFARPVGPWVKKTSSGPVSQEFDPDRYKSGDDFLPFVTPERQQIGDPTVSTVNMVLSQGTKEQSVTTVAASEEAHTSSQGKLHQQSVRVSPQQQQQPQVQQSKQQQFQHVQLQSLKTRERTASSGEYSHSYADTDHKGMPTTDVVPPRPSPATADPPPPVKPGDPLFDPWCDPSNPRVIQFQDVSAAAFKIKSGILNTPCTRSNMSRLVDCDVFFKKEFNQYTGSFKERGARYTLLCLSDEQRQKGVIAASAGNHALALSYHGQSLGIPVTVVMPLVAPIMKVQACRQYGANVMVTGRDISECREVALKMARDSGLLYINGYDHPHILAGQGTIGLEIVEQVNNIDAVVVPVGGGGLIAGLALAVKSLYPHIKVIGVESEQCPSFSSAMKAGKPVYTKTESSLADGLAVPMVGVNAFATASKLVDKVVSVREEWIAIAILRLVEMEKAVVEGAGATALAALLAGKLPELTGKRVVIPLCGGNIDTTVLGRCLERGLAADGRLVKFTVTVSDRPGGIAELTRLLANLGVSIKDMMHERAWIKSDIFSVEVKVVCETRDYEHLIELKGALEKRYKEVRFNMPEMVT